MNKITVVSVDDHYLIHEAIRSLLAGQEDIKWVGEGYAVNHLFPLIEEHRPDVLILDFMIPQQEGYASQVNTFSTDVALAKIRERYPDTAVIILSEHPYREIVQCVIEHGVRGCLWKSDNLCLNLPDAIRAVHKGGVFFSEAFSQGLFYPQPQEISETELLTERQREVVLAIAKAPDTPYAQIANELGISLRTLKGHLCAVYNVLGVNNITACIIRCMQLKLIPLYHDAQGAGYGDTGRNKASSSLQHWQKPRNRP